MFVINRELLFVFLIINKIAILCLSLDDAIFVTIGRYTNVTICRC
jgi:hypothetical protein